CRESVSLSPKLSQLSCNQVILRTETTVELVAEGPDLRFTFGLSAEAGPNGGHESSDARAHASGTGSAEIGKPNRYQVHGFSVGQPAFQRVGALPKRDVVRPQPVLRDFLERQLAKAEPIVLDVEPSDCAPETAEGAPPVNRVQQFLAASRTGLTA